MGWKSLKDHFQIKHIVHVSRDRHGHSGIFVGSPYCPTLLHVREDGSLVWDLPPGTNEDLRRYDRELRADSALVAELIARKDTFAASIPVFFVRDDLVVESFCEEFGWPNVTHCGVLMYENAVFRSRREAIASEIESTQGAIDYARKWMLPEAESALAKARQHVERSERSLELLTAMLADESATQQKAPYPDAPPAPGGDA